MKEFTNEQLLRLHKAGASVETLASAAGVKEQRIKVLLRQEADRQECLHRQKEADHLTQILFTHVVAKLNADWSKDDVLDFIKPHMEKIQTLRRPF